MRKLIAIHLVLVIALCSCSSSDDFDNFSGTYEVHRILLDNCLIEEADLNITFGVNEECVETAEFIHCKKGSLIIRSDRSVTSTISISRQSRVLGITLPLLTINGQGILDQVGNIANLCIDDSCVELELSGGDLIWNAQSAGCNHQYVFRKVG